MANSVGLEFAARTDTGLTRTQNEDSVAFSAEHGFALLADGMGGYNAGEVASSMAIAVVGEALKTGLMSLQAEPAQEERDAKLKQLLVDSIRQANAAILGAARSQPEYSGMGTTLVAALINSQNILIAHVGDSRAYRFRKEQLAQITRDHSLLQEQIDAGLISPEQARHSHYRNLVTRAVGVDDEVDVEVHVHRAEPGDIYLLCSDGLTDIVDDEAISVVMRDRPNALEPICSELVRLANENGGFDNTSVVLIKVEASREDGSSLLDRFMGWLS